MRKKHKISSTSNSSNVLKQWVKSGRDVTFLIEFDVATEHLSKEFSFIPFNEKR